MSKNIFLIIGLLGLFASCSPRLSPFTSVLNDNYNWSEQDLKQIQFYLSSDIYLYREIGQEDSEIIDGNIRIRDGRQIEEIQFRKGTPGILLFMPKSDRFAISFEEEDTNDDHFLMFGPSKKANGRFVLLAKEWDKRTGKVTYNNKVYTTRSHSAFATILVDLKEAKNIQYKKKKVRGRKVH